ncbi:hypothetical protein IEN85_22615 [Pelagicoccus sp. NFK12]|uniref:5-bromo-4-chloroindolyl phosphate hydrolysis protein n=1 Tax=Pelagicoccus enzymogenes TaxID=2773457 RepID=A0A927IK72_9BACT|nr:hypothetical protein [Pelagicoccus enzymogenes]MBD5782310.1 hypothetical protein [Pelagicoccus enzymogenes]
MSEPNLEANETTPKEDKSKVSTKLLVALVIVGTLRLAVAIATAPSSRPDYQIGYVIGAVVFFPAIVMALIAISKSMRNSRAQSIVLLTVWGLTLFISLPRIGEAIDQRSDQEALEKTSTEIQKLKLQLLDTDEPREIVRIQEELAGLLDSTSESLSPSQRRSSEVTNEFMKPIILRARDYALQMAEFTESPKSDYTTVESQEDIEERIKILNTLTNSVINIIDDYDTIETDFEDHLAKSGLSERVAGSIYEGFETTIQKQKRLVLGINEYELELIDGLKKIFLVINENWEHRAVFDDGTYTYGEEAYDEIQSLLLSFDDIVGEQEKLRTQLLSGNSAKTRGE